MPKLTSDLDRSSSRLALRFASPSAVREFLDEAERQDGFLASLPEPLAQFERLEATLEVDGVAAGRLDVSALQVFPEGPDGHPTAFQLESLDARALRAALDRLEAGEQASVEPAGEPAGEESEETPRPGGETLGTSPIFRLKKMTPPEKIRHAPRANRTERQILIRDSSPQVLLALLANPYLESDDVLAIVKSPFVAGNVLQRVAKDRRWGASFEIRAAVVKNPKTPSPLAISLLPRLRTNELRALARSQEIRDNLKKAALKEYLKRSGQRR